MHRKIRQFELFEPTTVKEAVQLLSRYGNKAKILAGGVDIISRMMRWQIKPEYVVSIRRIPDLDHIEGNGIKGLKIGAMTTLLSIELSPAIEKDYAVLYEAVHQIASIQVKTMATVAGNLCVSTPASDIATALCVLKARLKIVGKNKDEVVPIEDFFVDVGRTILEPDQIVTEIQIPAVLPGTGAAFLKLKPVKASISKVNAAVMVNLKNGVCEDARIALGSVAPKMFRATKAEEILKGKKIDDNFIAQAAETAAEESKPITDLRSTAKYRQETVAVLVKRALVAALERGGNQ
jgi:carbon-monoxide dehydrogenase medium subunit